MDEARQRSEVERNYDAFVRLLASIVGDHRDQLALMRDGRIVDFFDRPGDAYRKGMERFPDGIFSIQEVTDEPIDLGFWSHVGN
ncbi:MAG: hypothetical protein QOH81_1261 [Sphingomonadales bacterium]|jgi:hypothetical protein|nr:hypothetical protein [Sphingomonadales bacterium]